MPRHEIDLPDNHGHTPLHSAVFHDDASIIHDLINHGANPNQQNHNGMTSLHFAAMGVKLNAIRALLSRGANPNISENNGIKPLHWLPASKNENNVVAIQYLCKNGADVNYHLLDMLISLNALSNNKIRQFIKDKLNQERERMQIRARSLVIPDIKDRRQRASKNLL